MMSQRDAQGQHEGAVEHTCFGRRDSLFEKKVALRWPRKTKRSEGTGATQKCRRVSLLRCCFISDIVTRLMYVPGPRASILLRDCSHMALTKPLERHAKQVNISIPATTIERGHKCYSRRQEKYERI